MAVATANEGLKEMGILFDYLEIFGVLGYVSHLRFAEEPRLTLYRCHSI